MTVSMTKTAALFTVDMANVLSYSIAFVCHFCDLFLSQCFYIFSNVCVYVYVVYEDTNLYNDMGMTQVLQGEGDLWGHFQCPHNLKRL